jgi:hypothetical protein
MLLVLLLFIHISRAIITSLSCRHPYWFSSARLARFGC